MKAIPGELIKPVVDGTFIVDTPRNLYKKGQFQHVPLITGINTHEGYMMMRLFGLLNPELPKQTTEDFRKVMQPMLMSIFHKNHEQLLDKLVDLYVKPGTLDDREKTLQSFCQFFGDLMFDGPQRFTVVNHSSKSFIHTNQIKRESMHVFFLQFTGTLYCYMAMVKYICWIECKIAQLREFNMMIITILINPNV